MFYVLSNRVFAVKIRLAKLTKGNMIKVPYFDPKSKYFKTITNWGLELLFAQSDLFFFELFVLVAIMMLNSFWWQYLIFEHTREVYLLLLYHIIYIIS